MRYVPKKHRPKRISLYEPHRIFITSLTTRLDPGFPLMNIAIIGFPPNVALLIAL